MKKFYFTFGYGHTHPKTGKSLSRCYTIIETEDVNIARMLMHQHFGTKWAFCYESAEMAGVETYGLSYVPLDVPAEETVN